MHGTPLRQRAQAIVRAGVPKCDPTIVTSRGQQATVGAVSRRGDRTVMGFVPLWPKVEARKAQQVQRTVRAADGNLLLAGGNGEAVQTAGDRDLIDRRAASDGLDGDPPAGIGREQPRAASDEANPNELPRPLTPADCGAGAGVPYESGPVAGARGEVLARWSEGQRVDYRLRPGQALLYRTSFSIPQFDREVGAGLIVKL